MKLLAFTFIIIVSLSLAAFSQTKTDDGLIEFTATFKDQNGAAIAAERVMIFDGREKEGWWLDADGKLSARLSPGLYELSFDREVSDSFRAVISLSNDQLNPQNVQFDVDACEICCGDCRRKDWSKPVVLARPPYPAVARAVRAMGAVSVFVTVGADGKVTEAIAYSGHPLLRAASVQAARSSSFEPSAAPHKINLVYYFLGDGLDVKLKRRVSPFTVLIEALPVAPIIDTVAN